MKYEARALIWQWHSDRVVNNYGMYGIMVTKCAIHSASYNVGISSETGRVQLNAVACSRLEFIILRPNFWRTSFLHVCILFSFTNAQAVKLSHTVELCEAHCSYESPGLLHEGFHSVLKYKKHEHMWVMYHCENHILITAMQSLKLSCNAENIIKSDW